MSYLFGFDQNVKDYIDTKVANATTLALSGAPSSATAATDTITSNNTVVSNGDTVVVNGKTYIFKTALTPAEGEVLIAGTADLTLTNLAHAINGTGGVPGTDYQVAAANPDCTSSAVASHAITLTSVLKTAAANALTLTKVATTLTLGGATFSGGVTPTPGLVNQFGVYGSTLYICTVANTTWKTVASLT